MSRLSRAFGWLGRDSSRDRRPTENEYEMERALSFEQSSKIENISNMIKQLNEKLKIALIIPHIFENPKTLGKCLKNTKYEPALKLVKEYREEKISLAAQGAPELNSSTNKVIDYFLENYEVLRYLPDWVGDLLPTEQRLVDCFRILNQVAHGRFCRNALEQMDRELVLQNLYNLNEQVHKDVKQIRHKIEKRKVSNRWRAIARGYVIYKLEEQLQRTRFNNQFLLKEEIASNTRVVRKTQQQHNLKQKELQEDVKKAQSELEKKFNKNLSNEEEARAEKNKLLLQLQSLVNRYDQVMFEKFSEEILLDQAIEKLQKEVDDFQPEFNREEQLYIELVVKKEEEYQRLLEERVEEFRLNYAAKKIQIWFRNIMRKKAKAKLNVKEAAGKKATKKRK